MQKYTLLECQCNTPTEMNWILNSHLFEIQNWSKISAVSKTRQINKTRADLYMISNLSVVTYFIRKILTIEDHTEI